MSQHDYVIANGTGAAVRSDLNGALAAIVSNNSGATAPSTTYAYQWWADTTTGLLKLRNAANNAWITLFQLDGEWSTLAVENGSASAPSIYFKDSGTDTGIYSPGADQVAISTNGSGRLFVNSTGLVGIGTASPDASYRATIAGSRSGVGPGIFFSDTDASPNNYSLYINGSKNFVLYDSTNAASRITVTPAGLVGIGTTSPVCLINGQIPSATSTSTEILRLTDSVYCDLKVKLDRVTTVGNSVCRINTASGNLAFETSDTERARIDSSGRLLVGTSSAFDTTTVSTTYQAGLEKAGGYSAFSLKTNANTDEGAYITLGKSRGTTANSKTVVNNGDTLGAIAFEGADGASMRTGAQIQAYVDGTPGSGDLPCRLTFSTTADGASSPTERFRIRSDGNMGFFNTPGIYPNTDNGASVGFSGNRWSAIYAVNGTIQTSDERAKTDVTDSFLGSSFIKALRPVSYKWIEGGKRDTGKRDEDGNYIYEPVPGQRTHWGFIAQEVKQAVDAAGVDFGGWVLTDKDDPDSQQALRYDQFIAPLTKALQEALAEIDVLKAKVAALEAA